MKKIINKIKLKFKCYYCQTWFITDEYYDKTLLGFCLSGKFDKCPNCKKEVEYNPYKRF